MEESVFTKIIKGVIPSYKVYEDEKFIAILDINPINPGHVLVIPKQQIDYLYDLPDDLYQELFTLAKRLAGPIKEVTKCLRVGLVVEGLDVPHVHVKLIPLHEGDQICGPIEQEIPKDEFVDMQEKILLEMDQ